MGDRREYLITGGAGFIGCNYADRLLSRGELVTVYDNLSRVGSQDNLAWLFQRHGDEHLRAITEDVRHYTEVIKAVREVDIIVHLAAQTAVTTSVEDPWADFTANAAGTLNVLEAARHFGRDPIVLYASTNKVYGAMGEIPVAELGSCYVYRALPLGVPETQPLDFHSPYGCSKGAADQYVRDYARIYHMRTVVFRQSCVYGPRQIGLEDQGWVAWFVIAALNEQPITIYGDGKQVRDVLYIDDLLDAYDAAIDRISPVTAGEIYNIGGGPENTVSVWAQFGPMLEELLGREIPVTYAGWRPGDQKVYISDIRKAAQDLDWHPQVGLEDGLRRLHKWLVQYVV